MAESADKTPTKGADLDEESDVVELTEEVGVEASSETEGIPEPDSLDSMGLKMPEFKMPGADNPSAEADGDKGAASAPVESPKTQEMYAEDFEEESTQPLDDESPGADSEPVAVESSGAAQPEYDRQAMVKTIQMEAFDRDAFKEDTASARDLDRELLDDSRFAPEIIVSPPPVLVKKWREGLPGDVEIIVGGDRRSETASAPPVEEPETSEAPVDDGAFAEDAVEPTGDEEPKEEGEAAGVEAGIGDSAVVEDEVAGDEVAQEPPGSGEPETIPEIPPEPIQEPAPPVAQEESEPIELDDELEQTAPPVAQEESELIELDDELEQTAPSVAQEESEPIELDDELEQTAPPVAQEESEPIELDDELVEIEDDDLEAAARPSEPPPHSKNQVKSSPPPAEPGEAKASTPPKSAPPEEPGEAKASAPPKSAPPEEPGEAKASAPPKSAPPEEPGEATPSTSQMALESDEDDEMKGLVEELMEEEKQQRQKRQGQLRPRDIWFKEVFTEEYLRTVPSNIAAITRDEVDFIEASLRLKKKSRILDLACGYGRHSLEMARRDYEMVGLDLSKPLLRHALESAKKQSLDIKFIHGDMRKLGFSSMFDGCFIWDTSLGYFDDRTNLAVLQGVHRAMKVGGRLLVDVLNRDYVVDDTPTRLWWEGNGCIFLEETEFDYQRSTLEVERSYIYEDGTPPLEHKSFIRLYSVHELRQMLHVAGFKVLEVSGAQHHKGYFLGTASERIIVLAEKRKRRRASAPGTKKNTSS